MVAKGGGGGETTRSTPGKISCGVSNNRQEVIGGATQSAVEWEIPPPLHLGVEELDQVHNSKRDFLFMT